MSNSTSSSSTTTDLSSSILPEGSESDHTLENEPEDVKKVQAILNSSRDSTSSASGSNDTLVGCDQEKLTDFKPPQDLTKDFYTPSQIPVTVLSMESSEEISKVEPTRSISSIEEPAGVAEMKPERSIETEELAIVPDLDDETLLESFPVGDMIRLEEMISNPRWVVPVLPGGQLEILLDASIQLCKRGLDIKSEHCQRFFREGLTVSFSKILTDDAVSSWKPEIQKCILKNSERLVDLIVSKLSQDWFPLLELLGILFNPSNKFHSFNGTRQPDLISDPPLSDDTVFARPPDSRYPKGMQYLY